MILTVLALCVCLPAWAEETGQPAAVSEESAAPVPDVGSPDGSGLSEEEPAPAEEETPDAPAIPEETPAAPAEDGEGSAPENAPGAEHTALHQTWEMERGAAVYVPISSPDVHGVKRTFDLYCGECQRVVTENYRVEDVYESHEFTVLSRTEPTCDQEGQEHVQCVLCGDTCVRALPRTEHEWGPWSPLQGNEQTLIRFCQHCGKQETRPNTDAPDPQEPGNEPPAEPTEKPEEPVPIEEHTAEHPTHEIPVGEPVYQSLGEPNSHRVIRRFSLFCDTCQRVVQEAYRVDEADEYHVFSLQSSVPSTCTQPGTQTLFCPLCGDQRTDEMPLAEHLWTEWVNQAGTGESPCQSDQVLTRWCQVCGQEETQTVSATGHQWLAVSYTEATCTQDGVAVRRCAVCGQEEVIPLPAYGHSFVPDGQSGREVCAVCGEEKITPREQQRQSHMYYNNTVTSFGPTTRELIGGSVWNRVTPVDLSEEGVFTYPLVASNQYTVGTATLVNGQDGQEVKYKLSSPNINVHSESLVVYPDLEALKTGSHAVSFDFNEPIDLKAVFGKDARVIVAITLKADYDADSTGVSRFWADQKWIDQMMEMIK